MRILHVAAIVAESPTGPAASVPLQMRAELGAGHEVAFLQSHPGGSVPLPPGVRRFGHGMWADALGVRALLARGAFEPDVVHFHSVYLVRHAVVAAIVRRLGVATVNSPRGGLMPAALGIRRLKKRLGDRLFFDRFCRDLSLHRALNEPERDSCLRRYPAVPVRIAGNPIDLESLPPAVPPRPTRARLVLGYLGRLDPHHKGLDVLLEGFRLALDSGLPDGIRLRLAGPDHRGGVRLLRRLVRALELETQVEIIGPLEGSGKHHFLEGLDVFVHPSRFEGMPMGVLEAMAIGRPVLVTPETNLGDVVERHGAGWVVGGNPDAIARTMLSVAADPDVIATRGAAGRSAVRAEFSLDAVGARLTTAYSEVVERTARKAA
jgi:glycosyltransferase involved in cell wall biosynthesis